MKSLFWRAARLLPVCAAALTLTNATHAAPDEQTTPEQATPPTATRPRPALPP